MLKKPPYFRTFVALSTTLMLLATAGFAEKTRFESAKFGFSAEIPENFEQLSVDAPGVGIALRNKEVRPATKEHLPTLTVTIHPGKFVVQNDPKFQADEIATSYRAIGLSDVSIVETKKIKTFSGEGLEVQLRYKNQGQEYISSAVRIPGEIHHYIVTFLDHPTEFAASHPVLESFVSEFRAGKLPEPVTKRKYPVRDQFFMIFSAVFALTALVAIAWYTKRNTRSAPPSPQ